MGTNDGGGFYKGLPLRTKVQQFGGPCALSQLICTPKVHQFAPL